jgi:hypothetical protein
MSIDTYGLPEEKYLELVADKAMLTFKALNTVTTVASGIGLNLSQFTDKFLWDLFQEITYAADDAARVIQKDLDPEEVKRRQWDSIVLPSRDELMEEIKSVNAKVEALTDYLADLLKQPS